MRINPQNFPVQDQRGQRFGLLRHLQSLRTAGAIGEWRVVLGGIQGRVCALRKSDAAIQQAHRRLARRASLQSLTKFLSA